MEIPADRRMASEAAFRSGDTDPKYDPDRPIGIAGLVAAE
jgi:hypothetical protein